jgi:hypothetical protein
MTTANRHNQGRHMDNRTRRDVAASLVDMHEVDDLMQTTAVWCFKLLALMLEMTIGHHRLCMWIFVNLFFPQFVGAFHQNCCCESSVIVL